MTEEEMLRRINALEECCSELRKQLQLSEEARRQAELKEAAMRSVLLQYKGNGGYKY
jgi:hypothetical protein